jgi:hypothetical protein
MRARVDKVDPPLPKFPTRWEYAATLRHYVVRYEAVLRLLSVGACLVWLAFATIASAGTGNQSTDKTKFIAAAERACVSAKAKIDALPKFPFKNFDALHPDRKTLVKVGQFFTGPGNEVPVARSLVRQLEALGTPPSSQAAWHDVLAKFREFITVIRREAAAALRADMKSWVNAVQENRLLPGRLSAAAKAFGAKRCAIFH